MIAVFIVIEGIDGTGKTTQANNLVRRIYDTVDGVKESYYVKFPNYYSNAGSIITNMLNGGYGENPNPYATSAMYSLDRWDAIHTVYENAFNKEKEDPKGIVIVCDRYTQSNLIHQSWKVDNYSEYRRWLFDLEFKKFKLPVPDKVYFLTLPVKEAMNLLRQRDTSDDINEQKETLENSFNRARTIAKEERWTTFACFNPKDSNIRSINEISDMVYYRFLQDYKDFCSPYAENTARYL